MLDEQVAEQYRIAGLARKKNKDPSDSVESVLTRNLAERVEGLVGPKYIADEIKKGQAEGLSREKIVERTIDWILKGAYLEESSQEERIDQALRTALAILTEGVVSAPLEGISQVVVKKNPDGSNYLSIFFAGPIRGAGGTAAALTVLIGDYIRQKVGIQEFRPTETEVERYKEELKIYHRRVVRLQYMPSDEEIEKIVKNVPICIDGDPTEQMEVDIHKNLERVRTNRIRGGVCLVIGEGIAQKYKKILKFSEVMGLKGWEWLKDLKKEQSNAGDESKKEVKEIRPNKKFLEDIIAGRPIFAYPSTPGGFRLRYGRCSMGGIASKAIHSATMEILDEFPVVGTQLRIERPGKGMVSVPCNEIEGPVVKDMDGNVIRITDAKEAKRIAPKVKEILFLGDILISFGDFLNSNEVLPPSGYVEEWWSQEYKSKSGVDFAGTPTGNEAVSIAKESETPLHPKYTFFWHDLDGEQLKLLVEGIRIGLKQFDEVQNRLVIGNGEHKRVLELLCIPHNVQENGEIEIVDYAIPLLMSLGILKDGKLDYDDWFRISKDIDKETEVLTVINELSELCIRRKAGAYIGGRMGRPEKAKERRMDPGPHVLFPVGDYGGRVRSINTAAKNAFIQVDVARMRCPTCKKTTFLNYCTDCGSPTYVEYKCSCGVSGKEKFCKRCKKEMQGYEESEIPIKAALETASKSIGMRPQKEMKGVVGMMSRAKIPESLEKGILRSMNDIFVFKDGTIRFDATDVPLSHFKPEEIGTSIERLKELGYEKDIDGRPLEQGDQIVEMKVQDIILPCDGIEYMSRVCKFVDELLEKFYGLDTVYNVKARNDLVGQLIVGLAPHTSSAILGRIIGFADVRAILAHPYWHAAKRRNCDGDEDSIMLLMDVLLNFSFAYLPEKRGGRMDAPLVINTNLDPKEVDSEAHCMETVRQFSLEFYEETQKLPYAKNMKVPIVEDLLDTDPYSIGLTHYSSLKDAPKTSQYVQLGDMQEKATIELRLCSKIRAVDANDVAKRLINSHLIRDTYGNLRAFARQKFRCVKCNKKYRRVPLIGKCDKCGGRVILTVSKGSIEKYVNLTDGVIDKYVESEYIKQRMELVKAEIKSVFENDKIRQFSLSEFA
jgi:DNA polymerase II large subunit